MIVSTVWGTPAPDTAWRLPRTPCLSIRHADAERLRQLLWVRLHQGAVRITLTTRVRTGWIPIPLLVAHLDGHVEDRFVLLSGHVDSWHHGAMDNAAANATMLEVARLLGGRRDRLRRGLRVAFWSGHSHGRYAGSAWYADHAWSELHRRCVLHLNADSTGARGATDYSTLHATEDAQLFAEAVVRDLTGQPARGRRISRAGDQSFWGAGVPSAFMSLSGIPKQDTELSRAMERLLGTSGFPWWWHTREDTVDKIDAGVLTLDTKVYLSAALRAVNAPVLPLDHAWTARALLAVVEELRTASASRFDLAPVATAARGPVGHAARAPRRRARPRCPRDPGRRAEARRDAHDRPPHRSRVARPPLRDDRARRVGLLEHPRVVDRDRREARAPPEARDVVGRDLADAGALQAAAGCPVPRRDAARRGGGEVHARPGAQGHAARALGEPRRAARRRRGGRRPHGGRRHERAVRPDLEVAGASLRGHRLADGGREGRARLQPGARRHGALQIRRVEDQHARDPDRKSVV